MIIIPCFGERLSFDIMKAISYNYIGGKDNYCHKNSIAYLKFRI